MKQPRNDDYKDNSNPDDDIDEDEDELDYDDDDITSHTQRHQISSPPRPPRPPRAPPLPPLPPLPPVPHDIEFLKSDKVIGIRGLDSRLYKDISRIAKKNGVNIAELINHLFAKYRYTSLSENGNTICNIDSLELFEEDITHLDEGETISIIGIKNLLLGADITHESFNRILNIEHIERIWVPSHLYLPLVKKVRNCNKIEKYKGDKIPRVIQKSFDSDVHLTNSFFEYLNSTYAK